MRSSLRSWRPTLVEEQWMNSKVPCLYVWVLECSWVFKWAWLHYPDTRKNFTLQKSVLTKSAKDLLRENFPLYGSFSEWSLVLLILTLTAKHMLCVFLSSVLPALQADESSWKQDETTPTKLWVVDKSVAVGANIKHYWEPWRYSTGKNSRDIVEVKYEILWKMSTDVVKNKYKTL